ncbi:MAG: PspC domain-containing protein, partial [Chitinophagales bacterium]|nr:PspC domain-containing protein [Chitinophagales bacterium]
MKKVININFQGSVVPIEESAYDILRQYIDSLRTYFSEEEGKDEIINDIESRISELFQERLKGGATCITDDDVNAIIDNMGRPKDFAAADSEGGDSEHNDSKRGSSSSQYQWQPNQGRLFRDEHNKILGGVCSGIGNYLRIDPWIVRILFIISGIGILAYLILWIFIPSNIGSSTG